MDWCLQPLMVEGEKPGEVEEPCAIEVYTSEVTNTDVADITSICHVRIPSHVCTRKAQGVAQGHLGRI